MKEAMLATVEPALIWPLEASKQSKDTVSPEAIVIAGGMLNEIYW